MSELPRLHTPKEIADSLGTSEWWVKERARRREIPFELVGGAYRFTRAHWEEILSIFEQRPELTRKPAVTAPRRRAQPQPPSAGPVVRLQARQPQRGPKAG